MKEWNDGVLEYWSNGILEERNVGIVEYWNNGILGTMECWNSGELF
jgi:hypothetical protein